MPMYEYYCRECGTTIEKLRPADARDQPVACPTDATHRTKRLLSVFAVSTSSRGESARPAGGGGCACGGNCGCRN